MAQRTLEPLVPQRARAAKTRIGRAFLLLAALELAVFGVWSWRMGFYHDDWANLERLLNAGGVWAGIKLYAGIVMERPVESLQYPLLFAIGGLHPLPYQVFYVLAEIVEGWLLFLLLLRLTQSESLALLASALVLIFPTHSITHLWLGSSALVVTLNLTLASLLLHLRWIERKKTRDLALGQFLYLVGVLNYEVAAFLPLMLAGGLLARDRQTKGLAKRFLPYAVSFGAALFWQRAIVSFILARNPRAVELSPDHIFWAYEAGLECVANRVFDVFHRMMPVAWLGLGLFAVLAAQALAAGAAWIWWQEPGLTSRASLRTALGMAAGGFIGACAPYALSADYMPMVYGVMSRTNGVIGVAGGILWACGLDYIALRSRKAAALALGLVVFCMTLADWGSSLQWARSWDIQQSVLARLFPKAQALPPSPTILLTDTPAAIEPGAALVFAAHWDIGSALRILTGRKDITADVVSPQNRVFKNAIEVRPGMVYPYPVYLFSNATSQGTVKTGS